MAKPYGVSIHGKGKLVDAMTKKPQDEDEYQRKPKTKLSKKDKQNYEAQAGQGSS